jgi:hypothetical protein
VQAFRCQQREPFFEVETHLAAEDAARADPSAVTAVMAVL